MGEWKELKAKVVGDEEQELTMLMLVDESFTEPEDKIRATISESPFGFVAAIRGASYGPCRYRQTAMEWAENHHRDGE